MIKWIKGLFGKRTTKSNNAVFEFYKGKDKKPRWRLKAPNHEIIASGEGYESIAGCMNGIRAVRKYAANAALVGAKDG